MSESTGTAGSGRRPIEWVCFDVGEVLIDETRIWATWAQVVGVSSLTFAAAVGYTIARGLPQERAFDLLGVSDWRARSAEVDERFGGFRPDDVHPDALRAVEAVRTRGLRVAIVANQPAARHQQLLALGFRPDVIAMSEELGVQKPDPRFFARILDLTGQPPPGRVVYVGDRVDNDVGPARAAGLRAVWLRRGPWGRLLSDPRGDAELVVWTLDELVARLDELGPVFDGSGQGGDRTGR
jgi:FMN hydrolase / 5-amino-6-(5-phospho-D-ribitylamino)uracil phosphatase